MNCVEKKNRKELVELLRSLADNIEEPSTEIDGGISIRNNIDSYRELAPFGSLTSISQSISIEFDLNKYNIEEVRTPE